MGRPVNASSEETRIKLRVAAGELFASQGIGSTSVREIAAKAGVNGALVSHYFGGKQGLYDACIESMYAQLAELQAELLPVLQQAGNPGEALTLAVGKSFRLGRRNRNALRLVMRDILDKGQLPQDRYLKVQSPFLESVPQFLAPFSHQTTEQLRWSIQSLVFLVVRYALSSDEELARLAGNSNKPAEQAEAHLISLAIHCLSFKTHNQSETPHND